MFKLGKLQDFRQDFDQATKIGLGQGAFGEVFSIISNLDNQRYAIKKMVFFNFDSFKESFQKFFMYIRMPVQHPNIVELKKIYMGENFQSDGSVIYTLYIQMEQAADSLMQDIIKRATQKQFYKKDEIREMAFQMLQALGFLKEVCGIHHRDVKCDNILKFYDQTKNRVIWKLANLGGGNIMDPSKLPMSTVRITQIYQQSNQQQQQEGQTIIGIIKYASPELTKCMLDMSTDEEERKLNYELSDANSLGKTLITAISLGTTIGLEYYNKSTQKWMTQNEVNQKMNQVLQGQDVDSSVVKLLQNVLQIDPKLRLPFKELSIQYFNQHIAYDTKSFITFLKKVKLSYLKY